MCFTCRFIQLPVRSNQIFHSQSPCSDRAQTDSFWCVSMSVVRHQTHDVALTMSFASRALLLGQQRNRGRTVRLCYLANTITSFESTQYLNKMSAKPKILIPVIPQLCLTLFLPKAHNKQSKSRDCFMHHLKEHDCLTAHGNSVRELGTRKEDNQPT